MSRQTTRSQAEKYESFLIGGSLPFSARCLAPSSYMPDAVYSAYPRRGSRIPPPPGLWVTSPSLALIYARRSLEY